MVDPEFQVGIPVYQVLNMQGVIVNSDEDPKVRVRIVFCEWRCSLFLRNVCMHMRLALADVWMTAFGVIN